MATSSAANNDDNRGSGSTVGWRETIRSLLERAVSDWSVKSLFRPVTTSTTDGKDGSRHHAPGQRSLEESSSDSMPDPCPREEALTKIETELETSASKTMYHLPVASVGHDPDGSRRKWRDRPRQSGDSGDTTDVRHKAVYHPASPGRCILRVSNMNPSSRQSYSPRTSIWLSRVGRELTKDYVSIDLVAVKANCRSGRFRQRCPSLVVQIKEKDPPPNYCVCVL